MNGFSVNKMSSLCLGFCFLFAAGAVPARADTLEKVAKKISAGAKGLQNKKVAVLPFPYHDGRESQGSTIISERLITKLVEQKKLEVIERSLLEKVLKELKLQSSGAVDEQSAKQIGKILGVEAIVSGTLIDLGEKDVEVNARLIQTESGQIVVAASCNVERFWQDEPATATSQTQVQSQPAPQVPPQQSAQVQSSQMPPPSDTVVQTQGQPLAMSNRNMPQRDSEMRPNMHRPDESGEFEEKEERELSAEPADFLFFETETGHELNTPQGREIMEAWKGLKNREGADVEKHFMALIEEGKGSPKVREVAKLVYSLDLFTHGKKEKAIRVAEEVAQRKDWPRVRATAHFMLGHYAETLGRPEHARENYLQVVRLVPFQSPMVRKAGKRLQHLTKGRALVGEKIRERMAEMKSKRKERKEERRARFRR